MKKELSYWPYKVVMILGAIIGIFGLAAIPRAETATHGIVVVILIIGGSLLVLLGKHLEKEQRIIYLLESYLSSINKSLSKKEIEKTCDACGKKISSYPCPYCGDPGAVIYNNIVR